MPMLVGIVVGIGLTIPLQLFLRCLSEAHALQLAKGVIPHFYMLCHAVVCTAL